MNGTQSKLYTISTIVKVGSEAEDGSVDLYGYCQTDSNVWLSGVVASPRQNL